MIKFGEWTNGSFIPTSNTLKEVLLGGCTRSETIGQLCMVISPLIARSIMRSTLAMIPTDYSIVWRFSTTYFTLCCSSYSYNILNPRTPRPSMPLPLLVLLHLLRPIFNLLTASLGPEDFDGTSAIE